MAALLVAVLNVVVHEREIVDQLDADRRRHCLAGQTRAFGGLRAVTSGR
jgi:hypothetical protein